METAQKMTDSLFPWFSPLPVFCVVTEPEEDIICCYPPKTECGCPSGGGIKNHHIRYPSYGGTQKKKKKGKVDTVTWPHPVFIILY